MRRFGFSGIGVDDTTGNGDASNGIEDFLRLRSNRLRHLAEQNLRDDRSNRNGRPQNRHRRERCCLTGLPE